MGLFSEDFLNKVQNVGEAVGVGIIGSVGGGIASAVDESLIRVGVKRGNLTEKEIAEGAVGSREQLRAPTSGASSGLLAKLAEPIATIGGIALSPIMMIGGAAAVYFVYRASKRRGR